MSYTEFHPGGSRSTKHKNINFFTLLGKLFVSDPIFIQLTFAGQNF